WVVALGDGTDHSRERVVAALAAVAPSLPELYEGTDVESRLAGADVAVDPADTRAEVEAVLGQVAAEAGLAWPAGPDTSTAGPRGREGVHTDALAPLLAELQGLARAHPGATW
ncbi:MAG TPA: Phenylacetic acid catabolic protein, partial [Acidimicrobiales bacterium]|nr:Phenylacetic acid catabolic protein [Acidimicrobiales bacterium]